MPFPTVVPPIQLAGYAVRRALRSDVPSIVGLLLDDPVTAARETSTTPSPVKRPNVDLAGYYKAFDDVDADPNQFLAVVTDTSVSVPQSEKGSPPPSTATHSQHVDDGHGVVGVAQLTLIPGLTRGGALRLQIEGVHIANHLQGRGIGGALFAWTDEMGRLSGAKLAQLTSDKKRTDAHRFYERLGWIGSHEGMKKSL